MPVRAADSDAAAQVKGDARMARGAAAARCGPGWPSRPSRWCCRRGSRRWRVPGYEIAELVAELRDAGRPLRRRPGHARPPHRARDPDPDGGGRGGCRRPDPRGGAADPAGAGRGRRDLAEAADPVRLVLRLLSDPAVLASAADGRARPGRAGGDPLGPPPPRGPGSARWSAADAVLIDEASDLIERTPSLAHVVVDEAQDLSPDGVPRGRPPVRDRLGHRARRPRAGHHARPRRRAGRCSWTTSASPDAGVQVLETGYRVPRQILDFASTLLPALAPGLAPARSLRQDPGSLTITRVAAGELAGSLAAACAQALSRPGSAAVIAADEQVAALHRALAGAGIGHEVLDGATSDGRLTLVPVTLAKGLEFDHVIVVEPARIAAPAAGPAPPLRRRSPGRCPGSPCCTRCRFPSRCGPAPGTDPGSG